MKNTLTFVVVLITFDATNASNDETKPMTKEEKIAYELHIIDSLLQSEAYAAEMAIALDASYYKGIGQTPPPFFSPGEDTITISKPVKEEKIATNIAGFYALESGICLLCKKTNQPPHQWLQRIINDQAGDSAVLLLNRFANATWKAGQPFRSMTRIKKTNFISASALTTDEVAKDWQQIKAAASMLTQSLKPGTMDDEMQQLRRHLHDTDYALHMATFINSSYYTSLGQPDPVFISPVEEHAMQPKSFREEKIAMNLAGFYATECATNYLVTITHKTPSEILQSLADNNISEQDKELYARFANATWKAGQPFRALNRISRETFTPFYFLTEADIDKDIVQVKAAAQKILAALK